MKKTIFLLFLTFSTLLSYSQKKEFYVNDNFEYITETEFNKKHINPLDYNLRFELDTCYMNVKVSRYKKGKINLSLLDSIKKSFTKKNNQEFNESDILLINYFPGDKQMGADGYKTNFKKKYNQYYHRIAKIGDIKLLFIYKSSSGLEGFGQKINWQPDINNLIENTFYPIHYPNGGYVIIDSKGNYVSERGEYCYSDTLIELIKTFTNDNE
ncbi:MAG: hypothetical protein CVU07_12430 [Bacteroidetes bacterium HGW-Bacteroidetes-23]|nr:MAG: hypothetical protein CVU07_12430 [Bacteroidetes bacterium HGW-Bacteroidetes-23]